MFQGRRSFLGLMLGATAIQGIQDAPEIPPNPRKIPIPKAEPPDPADMAGPSDKIIMQENSKDIKKDVQKLYELATDLKAEADKTDSEKVLSLKLLRKLDEIERLTKEIRSRTKG